MMHKKERALKKGSDLAGLDAKRMKDGVGGTDCGFGLAATGSCHAWQVDIDEAIGGAAAWYAQIEGPNLYLYFHLVDLHVIAKIIRFLHRRASAGRNDQPSPFDKVRDELLLGSFGRAPVLLLGDDEFADRCFLVVGPRSRSCMRLALLGADIRMLLEAFRQAAADLPPE